MNPKTRYWIKLVSFSLVALLIAFFSVCLYVSRQWALNFLHPAREISAGDSLRENKIPYQDVELITKDGVKLSAWYTPPQNGAVILVAHGYADNRPERVYVMLAEAGYGVLAWDFRAHGTSGGDISTLGYFEQLDAEAALDYVLAQPDVKHIGGWGGSMGASTLILTAARRTEIEALVSDSAFPSLNDVMQVNVPFDFLRPMVKFWGESYSGADIDAVNPVDEIGKIAPRAVLVIDGWEGAAIIMNSPYRLYDAANDPKEIWAEDGVPHLGTLANNPQKYKRKVIGFFDEYLLNQK
ncbi:MAG: alpha/beta hydrolase [Anaerolineales bacterium]